MDQAGLAVYGAIDHSDFYNNDGQTWWTNTNVRRSIFMGDFIYAISDRGVTVHRPADMVQVGALGRTDDDYCEWCVY